MQNIEQTNLFATAPLSKRLSARRDLQQTLSIQLAGAKADRSFIRPRGLSDLNDQILSSTPNMATIERKRSNRKDADQT